nr:PREDICTED: neurochondrin [Latimeria chalumnae]|eukprot:XP_014352512.1 PREDICTED: neurochondrin [Latimeria chalumnae]
MDITKVVKAGEADAKTLRRIFDAVGFTFPNRLLASTEAPDGCPSHIFRALAVTLLACFCTDPDLAGHPQILNKIPIFNEIITSKADQNDCPVKSMIDDAYQCLGAIAATTQGRQQLVSQGGVSALCRAFLHQGHGCSQALGILSGILSTAMAKCWKKSMSDLLALLGTLSKEFCNTEDKKKFELCEILPHFLPPVPFLLKGAFRKECFQNLYTGLYRILNSKLSASQSEPALKLAGCLIASYGSDWILAESREVQGKFLALLINLACVEVRLCLEDLTPEEGEAKRDVVAACYSIVEFGMMVCAAEESSSLTEEQCTQLVRIMAEAFGAIIHYLKQVGPDKVQDSFVFLSVRLLSAWLAEETASLKEAICDLLPFLIQYTKALFERELASGDVSSWTAELVLSDGPGGPPCPTDALRLLLPGLCHLTAEEGPRRILISEGAPALLLQYFTHQWDVLRSSQQTSDIADGVEMSLRTSCGIFLNFVVTEPDLIRKEEAFSSLLSLLMSSLPSLVHSRKQCILAANFVTLGLMLSRLLANTPVLLETTSSKKFFGAAVIFLSKAYQAKTDPKDEMMRLEVSDCYQEFWEEISELWFLGMQAFASCVPLLPWIPELVLESDWLKLIFALLDHASPMSVDMELVTAFQGVLIELAEHSQQCKKFILSNGGEEKANLYGMAALEQCLHGE